MFKAVDKEGVVIKRLAPLKINQVLFTGTTGKMP
jgi:hypothetical protein